MKGVNRMGNLNEILNMYKRFGERQGKILGNLAKTKENYTMMIC